MISESDNEASNPAASSPRSVIRVLGLLDILSRTPSGCSLAQLSAELGTPKSSLLMLIRPLVAEHYLLRLDGRYILGPLMFRLSSQILNARQFPRLMRPFLEDLAERTQETVYLAVIDTDMKVATFVDMVASSKSVRFALPVGFVRPLYTTAAGRLLLAFQDTAFQDEYLANADLRKFTPSTIVDVAVIRRELVAIKQLGMAISIDEAIDGGGAIAAPVYGPARTVEAALVVAAPTSRLHSHLSTFQQAIREVAEKASGSMGNGP